MQRFIYYITHNITELMFAVTLVCFIYVLARMCKIRQSIALPFALTPLVLVWALQNSMTRQFMIAHIF